MPAPTDTPVTKLEQMADRFQANDPISALQIALMKEWARTDPTSSVALFPDSYVETFRDLAKAALTHLGTAWTEVDRSGKDK